MEQEAGILEYENQFPIICHRSVKAFNSLVLNHVRFPATKATILMEFIWRKLQSMISIDTRMLEIVSDHHSIIGVT